MCDMRTGCVTLHGLYKKKSAGYISQLNINIVMYCDVFYHC